MSTFDDFKAGLVADVKVLVSGSWPEAVDELAVELQCIPEPEAILAAVERLSFDDMEGLCEAVGRLTGAVEDEEE